MIGDGDSLPPSLGSNLPQELPNRAWIESLRGPRHSVSAGQLFDFALEQEAVSASKLVSVLTLFLVGAECPFRCTMCDLWKYTLKVDSPIGSIARQVADGLAHRQEATWIKLYNASNFFDVRSVPVADLMQIASMIGDFERVIVENHPRLLRDSITEFSRRIGGKLEVAMGLETIEPSSFRFLNKQFTLEEFRQACRWIEQCEIDARVFLMLQPPLSRPEQSVEWLLRSAQFAWDQHVRHVSIIPTRVGNGAMESLQAEGLFEPPTAAQLELALEKCLQQNPPGIVAVDLWDWEKLAGHCKQCQARRRQRLEEMNRLQRYVAAPSRNCNCEDLS